MCQPQGRRWGAFLLASGGGPTPSVVMCHSHGCAGFGGGARAWWFRGAFPAVVAAGGHSSFCGAGAPPQTTQNTHPDTAAVLHPAGCMHVRSERKLFWQPGLEREVPPKGNTLRGGAPATGASPWPCALCASATLWRNITALKAHIADERVVLQGA